MDPRARFAGSAGDGARGQLRLAQRACVLEIRVGRSCAQTCSVLASVVRDERALQISEDEGGVVVESRRAAMWSERH